MCNDIGKAHYRCIEHYRARLIVRNSANTLFGYFLRQADANQIGQDQRQLQCVSASSFSPRPIYGYSLRSAFWRFGFCSPSSIRFLPLLSCQFPVCVPHLLCFSLHSPDTLHRMTHRYAIIGNWNSPMHNIGFPNEWQRSNCMWNELFHIIYLNVSCVPAFSVCVSGTFVVWLTVFNHLSLCTVPTNVVNMLVKHYYGYTHSSAAGRIQCTSISGRQN